MAVIQIFFIKIVIILIKDDNFYDDDKAFLFNLTKKFVKKNKKSHSKAIKNFKDSSNFIKFGSDCKVLILSGNCLNDNNFHIFLYIIIY